jgi:NADPH-dependent curcumin reductase CurA
MSPTAVNRSVVLARRPHGNPVPDDFRVVDRGWQPLAAGQFRTRNLHISLDAGFRNWMNEDAGMSACFGMLELGAPGPSDCVLVSAAGGAVGSIAGQLAKLQGAIVVGIVGSRAKTEWIKAELGYDAAVIRGARQPLAESIRAACPGNLFEIVTRPLRLQGFMTHFRHARYPEARGALAALLRSGKLKRPEHRLHGIDAVPVAFCDLFAGRNFGKTVVSLCG